MTTNPARGRNRARRLAALVSALVLAWSGLGLAQAKPKDDALDDLLKKVEESNKTKDAPVDPVKPAKAGEVAPKDKDLDSLLEKLGQSKDEASPDGKAPPPPPGGEGDKPPMPDDGKGKDKGEGAGDKAAKPKPKDLSGKDKELDEHLAGDKKKPKSGEKPGGKKDGGGEDGPLGDLIKQMREVEQRLGQPDTGEKTRQKQTEIVKRMDTLIDQIRQSKSQGQAMRMIRGGKQPGKPGQEPGQMADGAPPTRPEKPNPKSILAKNKDAWGHLPPDLRAEMDNVFNEQLLPSKEDLIKRYYLSVSKKSLSRGD